MLDQLPDPCISNRCTGGKGETLEISYGIDDVMPLAEMYNVSFIAVDRVINGAVDDTDPDGIFVDKRTSNEADRVEVAADEICAIRDCLVNGKDAIVRVFVDESEMFAVIPVVTYVDDAVVTGLGWDTWDNVAVVDIVIFIEGSVDGLVFFVIDSLKRVAGPNEGEETGLS
ncbi:hypothetical protein NDU88_004607 [Pleurodeles waltl]|uniref:Uncharacterized protein n=1 Tax=Pleurodeles waltl TaxID=8319 RepID=A0AAV7WAU8_PLEWA|nr:hypothetical protein NDU88_004607 [Pleurodeles waltl]